MNQVMDMAALRAEVAWKHRECGPDCCITGDVCELEGTYSLYLSECERLGRPLRPCIGLDS